MTASVQRSIFDFQDRIIPKVKRTIPMTDWHDIEERITTENAEAIISALNGILTTKGNWPRFMVQHTYDTDLHKDIGTYISYWNHAGFYYCKADYQTGRIYDHKLNVHKPVYKGGHVVVSGSRVPTIAYIGNGLLNVDCDDGNTYTAIIDEDAVPDRHDNKPFDPIHDTEHLLLYLFIQGARADDLLPVMRYGPVFLSGLDGRYPKDVEIIDIAERYGITIPLSQNVRAWSPEHYPIQESCKNCSRWQNDRKACQIQGAYKTSTSGTSACHWHWNGTPFKGSSKKKRTTEAKE